MIENYKITGGSFLIDPTDTKKQSRWKFSYGIYS